MAEKPVNTEKTEAEVTKTVSQTPSETVENVGSLLRRARLAKKQEIRDIASYLCIRAQFLEAIEEGRTKELPGAAYAIGFVRSYAAYLGLNAGDMVSLYKAELSDADDRQDAVLTLSAEETESTLPGVKPILLSLLLILVIYGVSKTIRSDADKADFDAPQTVTVTNDVYKPADVSETAVQAPVPPPKPAFEAAGQPADPAFTQGVPLVDDQKEEPALETRHIYGQKNLNPRIVLVANSDTWIEVTRANGDPEGKDLVLISRTLKAGDRYQASRNSENLFLKTGNAGGLDVYVEGLLVPPIGPKGTTRSQIPLDPEYLLPKTAEDD